MTHDSVRLVVFLLCSASCSAAWCGQESLVIWESVTNTTRMKPIQAIETTQPTREERLQAALHQANITHRTDSRLCLSWLMGGSDLALSDVVYVMALHQWLWEQTNYQIKAKARAAGWKEHFMSRYPHMNPGEFKTIIGMFGMNSLKYDFLFQGIPPG